LKTLQISDNLIPHSSEARRVFTISNELAKRGHEVTVATALRSQKEKELVESILDPRVEITWYKPLLRFYKFSYSPGLYEILSNGDYDIIHAHSYRHYGTYIGSVLHKKKSIPYVLSPYGSSGYGSSNNLKPIYWIQDLITGKHPIMYADRILANTHYEKDKLIEFGAERKKIDVIYREVDVTSFRKLDEKKFGDTKTILFIGRITPIKGIELLIDSLSYLEDVVKLSIIGPVEDARYLKSLQTKITDKGLNKRVQFLDEVPYEEIPIYLSSALVLVLPSYYENLGGVLIEAQACECPVIATNVGGMNEIIQDQVTGFMLSGRNSEELAEKIDILYKEDDTRRKMGASGRQFVCSEFSTDVYIEKILQNYEKSVAKL
jgi:glycosyltransferase involved in cell wall biosynthesis